MAIRKIQQIATFSVLTLIIALALTLVFPQSFASAAPEDTEAEISFTPGKLELISVPHLRFGSHEISGTTQTYPATSIMESIEVSDLRGTGKGWRLTASLSSFKNEDKISLVNSNIAITNSKFNDLYGNTATAPTINNSVKLVPGGASDLVLDAPVNTGLGVWDLEWAPEKTILTVFSGSATAGKNTATIRWSLETTP